MIQIEQDLAWIFVPQAIQKLIQDNYNKVSTKGSKDQYDLGILHTYEGLFGIEHLQSEIGNTGNSIKIALNKDNFNKFYTALTNSYNANPGIFGQVYWAFAAAVAQPNKVPDDSELKISAAPDAMTMAASEMDTELKFCNMLSGVCKWMTDDSKCLLKGGCQFEQIETSDNTVSEEFRKGDMVEHFNGSTGRITQVKDDCIYVMFDGQSVEERVSPGDIELQTPLVKFLKNYIGHNFYNSLYGDVTLKSILGNDGMIFVLKNGVEFAVDKWGRSRETGELSVYPSKTSRNWEHWIKQEIEVKTWRDIAGKPGILQDDNYQVISLLEKYCNATLNRRADAALAMLKIYMLIERGYGGIERDPSYHTAGITSNKNIVINEEFDEDFNLLYPLVFKDSQKAAEFMSYPENVKLIDQYHMYRG